MSATEKGEVALSEYERDNTEVEYYTDKKANTEMTNDHLIYGEIICAFPHILGSLSSYMTLPPIPPEFPLI
jgi:hypothetical protein